MGLSDTRLNIQPEENDKYCSFPCGGIHVKGLEVTSSQ